MKSIKTRKMVFIMISVVTLIALIVGCGPKPDFWGSAEKGLILTYRAADKTTMKYELSSTMKQIMDMMGNEIENDVETLIGFSVDQKSLAEKGLRLGVTIDTMYISVVSPMGSMKPDLKPVIGKSFEMSLSPQGKEYDFEGIKDIVYDMAEGGKRNLIDQFQTIFPDLPGKPVKFGDIWTSSDTIKIDQGGMGLTMLFSNIHTLEGIETVDGIECVKVATKVKGSLSGKGQQGPADLVFDADIEGNDTWYFAYKKGILVKYVGEGLTEGTVVVSGPQDMSIPMTMEMDAETKLVK